MTEFGGCWESFVAAPRPVMKGLGDMGFKIIRLMAMWPQINPKPGIFVWNQLDESIDAIVLADMQVYLNPYWAPAHASGGFPTYEPYSAGCTLSDGKTFAKDKPYCSNPPSIDSSATYLLGEALGRRYGNVVDFWGIFNEPGLPYYPPAIRGGDWGKQFCDELVTPFAGGVLSEIPSAFIVGPEADNPDVLAGILQHFSDFRIVSCHPYAWNNPPGFPEDSYARLDAFRAVAGGRRLWISEIDGDASNIVAFATKIAHRGDVEACLFHQASLFVDDAGKPTALYEPMKELIAGPHSGQRRRAVAPH